MTARRVGRAVTHGCAARLRGESPSVTVQAAGLFTTPAAIRAALPQGRRVALHAADAVLGCGPEAQQVKLSRPDPPRLAAALVNLVVPGGGLILRDEAVLGLFTAGLFTFALNFTLAGRFLFPLNISPGWQRFGAVLVIATYLAAQIRMGAAQRAAERRQAARARRARLASVLKVIQAGSPQAAAECLAALRDSELDDLHLAVRAVQLAELSGDPALLQDARQNVRRLDRHGVYRAGIPAAAQPPSSAMPAPAGPRPGESL